MWFELPKHFGLVLPSLAASAAQLCLPQLLLITDWSATSKEVRSCRFPFYRHRKSEYKQVVHRVLGGEVPIIRVDTCTYVYIYIYRIYHSIYIYITIVAGFYPNI